MNNHYHQPLFRILKEGDKLGMYEQPLFRIPFTSGGPTNFERSLSGFPEYAEDKVKFKEEHRDDKR